MDKILGAVTRVDKKTNQEDRFTVTPVVYEKEEDVTTFPLTNLIAYGYARTDSAAKYLHNRFPKSIFQLMKEVWRQNAPGQDDI